MVKKIFFVSLLATQIFVLTACSSLGQKTAEKTTEKAIEKATGKDASVNINNKNININTNEGSLQVGETIQVPTQFPKDVFVISGTIKAAIRNNEQNGFTLNIRTDRTVSDVKKIYEDKLNTDGWKITSSTDLNDSASIIAEKGKRIVSVTLGNENNLAIVVLSVMDKK
jgi:hypothetical protein